MRIVLSLVLLAALAVPSAALEPSAETGLACTRSSAQSDGEWSWREDCRGGHRVAVVHEGEELGRLEVVPSGSSTEVGERSDDDGSLSGTGSRTWESETLTLSALGHSAAVGADDCDGSSASDWTARMEGHHYQEEGQTTATETCEDKAVVDGHGLSRTCTRETRSRWTFEQHTPEGYFERSTSASTTESRCERRAEAAGESVVFERCTGTSTQESTTIVDHGPSTTESGSSEETCAIPLDEAVADLLA